MKIICARLITGEELITKVVSESLVASPEYPAPAPFSGTDWSVPKGEFTLEDARIIALQNTGRGVGISFIPFAMANPSSKVVLNFDKFVMAVYPPEPNLERAYIGESSQIQLATEATAAQQGIRL